MSALQDFVTEKAAELGVVGVAVGVLVDGREETAFAGVTHVDNPLPVDAATLFQFGSTGKTFTATAIMRLVEQGLLELDAPVIRYLPDLVLRDQSVAERVTVLQLLNHTAGWDGDDLTDMGDGDDALARYVAHMATLQQVSPLGAAVSYNNAALSLAGHLIATVHGTTYEQAIRDLLLEPLGLTSTFFFRDEVMTRRFVVGHARAEDGTVTVARPWGLPRTGAPAGGMSATVGDQLAWARFHLGDGTAPDGTRLLSAASVALMQQPTAPMPGSALGDAVGISWLLKDLGDGVLQVGHGGTTIGQHSDFTMIPSRGFAVTSLTNTGPTGPQLNHAVTAWALEHYLGITPRDEQAEERSDEALAEYAGSFETIAVTVDVTVREGGLDALVAPKPEMAKTLSESGEDATPAPPYRIGLLPGSDTYVITEGPAKGMRGYFERDADGRVSGIHMGGRLATRVITRV